MNVVITGASRGIGKAIALEFASHGAKLFLTASNEEKLQRTDAEIRRLFPDTNVSIAVADLSNKEATIHLGNSILGAFNNTIDILVNNAGSFEPGSVHNEPDGLLEKQIATNLYSAYHLTRTLIGVMMKRKSGHIFNMCSIASLNAYPNGGAYSISKFALLGFSKNLREEMKPHNIKVTSIMPGAVLTDSWSGFDNSQKRIMEASDIAKTIYSCTQLSAAACIEEIVIRPQLGDL
jgi:short-subunit dehydrogenase